MELRRDLAKYQGAHELAMARSGKFEAKLALAEKAMLQAQQMMRTDSEKWTQALREAQAEIECQKAAVARLEKQIRTEKRSPVERARAAIEALLKVADYGGELAAVKHHAAQIREQLQARLSVVEHAFSTLVEQLRPGVKWSADPCGVASGILARCAELERIAAEHARLTSPAEQADKASIVAARSQ